jgi:fructose-1-phosphate kinase PfkB-like protein
VNSEEIGRSLGFTVNDLDSGGRALTLLHERGIAVCVITLGAGGAILEANEERWHALGKPVPVVSTVGSGDSFLGGLVRSLEHGSDWADALGDAVAAGTANALSAGGGRFTLQEFQHIRRQISIRGW